MNDLENRLGNALRHLSEQAPDAAGLEAAARLRHRRRRRTRTVVGAAVAVAALPVSGLLLSGPWSTSGGPGPATTPPSPTTSASPTAAPSEDPGPAYIGDTRMSDYGEVTVHEVDFPWRVPGATPSKGHQFGALDLEVCSNGAPIPEDAPGRYSPSEFWIIETWIGSPDEGPMHYSVGNSTELVLREPSLSASQMAMMVDGTCERGWLTFELPRGTQIGRVAYQPWRATPFMWRIP
jgi:hypothetical protein